MKTNIENPFGVKKSEMRLKALKEIKRNIIIQIEAKEKERKKE